MSSIWSDDATMASNSWYLMEEEINRISEAVKEERGENELAIITVVPEDWLDEAEMKTRKRKWQFWKGEFLSCAAPVPPGIPADSRNRDQADPWCW